MQKTAGVFDLKLYPKILKIIFSIWLGIMFNSQIFCQVEEVVPDSTLQAVLDSKVGDTVIIIKKNNDFLEAPIHYPARDSIIYSYTDSKIKMYGDAKVTFKDKEITADYIEMTMDKKELFAKSLADSTGQVNSRPKFKDGEEEFEVTILRYNFASGKAWVTDAQTKIEGQESSVLHSHITKMDTAGNLHIKDGKYTTCDHPTDPHFYFAITKGIMTSKKSVISGPAYLVIEGIPIYFLGLPFGFFPKQEKKTSGIIMPKFGEEKNRGLYLRDFGYYFAGGEKMDLTFKGDIYSKGSWKASTTSRYKKRYKFNGSVGLTVANNIYGEKDIDDNDPQRDFSIRWSHSQDSKAHPYRNFSANVNFSSSKFNLNNTYETQQKMNSTKSSSITFSRKFPNKLFNFTAKIGATQNSQTDKVSMNLPSGTFTVNRFYPFKRKSRIGKQKWYEKIDMRYSSNFENRVNSTGLDFQNMTLVDSLENGFKHSVPIQASFKLIPHMTLTPSLKYQGLLFFNYSLKEWDEETQEVLISRFNQLRYVQSLAPNINLNYSPRIYGTYTFKGEGGAIVRHVAKPSLSFNYRPDIGYDDSRYYDSVQMYANRDEQRYSIFDEALYRLPSVSGRSGNVNFRLGNNIEMKVRDKADTTGQMKKIKLIDDLSLSTSYNIFKDSLNLAPISLSARTRLLSNFDIKLSGTLDPYSIYMDTARSYAHTISTFELKQSGKPARLTNARASMSFSLPMKKSQGGGARSQAQDIPPDQGFGSRGNMDYGDYWEYDMPWSIRVSYSFVYSKPYFESKITQSANFSGNFSLTPNWKIDFSSGYDFVEGELTYTRLTINRKLHCWNMSLNLVPFGNYKSYTFQINVVSNMFKDVKFRKERSWRDNI